MLRERFCPKLSDARRQTIIVPDETILLLIEFRVRGNLRFLSHAETARVFQRASIRAGIKAVYSKGYNPRPKLSLPLPKSVGIEVDDDLLCLRVEKDTKVQDASDSCALVRTRLSEQLPDGVELLVVRTAKAPMRPCRATYLIAVREEFLNDELKSRIKRLLAGENLRIQRQAGLKSSRVKMVDVRPFLKSIELDKACIAVECKVSPTGSIRVDEILRLLGLDADKLAAPVGRTRVQWQMSES